jgi:hypothetical protein
MSEVPSKFYKINDEKYDVKNFIALCVIGILVKLLFAMPPSKDGLSGPATSAIWGYGIVGFSLIGMLLIMVSLGVHTGKNKILNNQQLITDTLPVLLVIFVIAWIVGINMNYYKRINTQGEVAKEFFFYSDTSMIFIILQLCLVFNSLAHKFILKHKVDSDKSYNNILEAINSTLNTHVGPISYIFTLINFVMAGIMQVVLKFFTTDG